MSEITDFLSQSVRVPFESTGITKELLDQLAFQCSYNKSLNKLSVTNELVDLVIADAHTYKTVIDDTELLKLNCDYRIKTPDSIKRKVARHPDLRFKSVFNDLLGLRLKVDSYNFDYPEYLRVVDMSAGKKVDDGYRAVHLYYSKDNYTYPIEIQLWSNEDYNFNLFSHSLGYKVVDSNILRELRQLYDVGSIKTAIDFRREMERLK